MRRKEYGEAAAVLCKSRYSDWDRSHEIRIAKKLEERYPEEILKYYRSGIGDLTRNATRKEYARKASFPLASPEHSSAMDFTRWHLIPVPCSSPRIAAYGGPLEKRADMWFYMHHFGG